MQIITESAFAKVNLTLDVLDKRPDGYHNIRSIAQTISLRDDVVLNVETGKPWQLHCYREVLKEEDQEPELSTEGLPQGRDNLAWKAAEVYFDRTGLDPHGLEIFINKRIPTQAGLGGGSADAAAVLRGLNRHFGSPLSLPALCELGFSVGCDVPFCVMTGTALVEGRGELLTPISNVPEMFYVVCKPDCSMATPEMYRLLDEKGVKFHPDHKLMRAKLQMGDLQAAADALGNVFEPIVMEEHFDVRIVKSMLLNYGALGAQMTGSGSAVFGIYQDVERAIDACDVLGEKYPKVYLAKSV